MDLNTKNLVIAGTAGGVVGLALTMRLNPEYGGVLLGALCGVLGLYASSLE